MHEGEAIVSWAGDGTDGNPYQSELNVNYDLQRWQQKDHANPPNGKFKIYFQCEESVLNQMEADGVQIVWSGEFVEEQE